MTRPPLPFLRHRAFVISSLLAVACLVSCSQQPTPETPDAGTCPQCGAGYVCNPEKLTCELTPEAVASQKIGQVKAGEPLPIQLTGVTVTGVVRPSEAYPAFGFFVQAEKEGPGLFVAVSPDDFTPPVMLGDKVNFQVTAMQGGTDGPQAMGVSGYERVATDVDVTPLVQDVSHRNDLIDNRLAFDSEVLAVEGDLQQDFFAFRPGEYFASMETKGGFRNSKFGLIVEQSVAEKVGAARDCHVTVHAVPMRAFLASAELWSFDGSEVTFVCPADDLLKALAISPTEVQLDFQRAIDPSTMKANGGSFTIAGLTVTNQTVNGTRVILTTSTQTARQNYTLTIDPSVKDLLGGSVETTDKVQGFVGYFPRAVLQLNEINCNAQGDRDLIELKATQAGSTANLQLTYDGSPKTDVLMSFPDTQVEVGDLIVVHLNADGLKGDAVYSETMSKDEQTSSTNYPGAWDFVWAGTVCQNDAAVLRIRSPRGDTQDAVPFYSSKSKARPPEFGSTWLRDLQMEKNPSQWSPSTCAGNWCSETTTPSSLDISVNTAGTGSSGTTHYSVQRMSDVDTNTNADWSPAKPATFGLPNY